MRKALPYLAFAACTAIWGSTWLVIKVGYGEVGPFTAAAVRFLLAGALLVPAALLLRIPQPRGREQWMLVGFVAALQFALDYGLVYWGEQFLASGLTAVLFATLPLWAALVARIYIGEPLPARKLGGVLLGIGGVALLFRTSLTEALTAPIGAMAAILLASLAVGLTGAATKRHGAGIHPLALTGWACALGGLLLVPVALVAGEGLRLPATWGAWWPILYLATFGSIAAFSLYYWLLRRWSVTSTSLISVFTPLVALGLGAAVLSEPITPAILLGAAAILGGTALATRPPRAQPT